MPVTKTIQIFQFDELDERAKEAARDWYRSASADDDIHEDIYPDAVAIGKLLGIEIGTQYIPTHGGKTVKRPSIRYSGWCVQGSGASFEGRYSYAKGAYKAVAAEWPEDRELHRIAASLERLQKPWFYKIEAAISYGDSRYCHSNTMTIEVTDSRGDGRTSPYPVVEDEIQQLIRDFADWIYSALEAEHRFRQSAEHIDDTIRANEYTFTGSGKREDA